MVALALPAFGSSQAVAQQQIITGSDVLTGIGLLFRAGVDSGGGELLTVSGNNGESASISGGTGTAFELGVRLDLRLFERPSFETELTIGVKNSGIGPSSDTSKFINTTLAVSQFYRFKSGVRLGAGIGLRLLPTLDVNVRGFESSSTTLENAPELRLMMEYGFWRKRRNTNAWYKMAIGVRAFQSTWEANGVSVDGSSAGVYLSWQI